MRAISSSGFHRRPRSWRGGLASHRNSDTVSVFQPLALSRSGRPASHALAHGPSATSPTSWTSRTGVTPFRWLRLLRSFSPPASPFPCALLSQTRRGRCSPGLRLSRALIRSSLGPSHDPADHSVRRGLVTAVAKGATPRRQVRPDDLAAATTSSASDPQGDCRPARATSRRQSCLPRPWGRRLPGSPWSSEV
jgi:hypothetical protein